MAYFQWASDLAVDDDGPIDTDHKKLVDLINELHTATSQGQGREVVERIMDELVAYTMSHFQREEAIMTSLNYPRLDGHRLGHQKFSETIQELQAKYKAGSITVASQLSTVLRDWLSLHIRRNDKDILEFARKVKGRKTILR